ncbi:MAG: AAA family ATPase [Candidatus Methylacidiphilales bacterium]
MSTPDATPSAPTVTPIPVVAPSTTTTAPVPVAASVPSTSEAPAWPKWALDLATLYRSNASSQFILYGNINDRCVLPPFASTAPAVAATPGVPGSGVASPAPGATLGGLSDFLLRVLMQPFQVVLSYDLGNGLRIEKGAEIMTQWPPMRDGAALPRAPRDAIEALTRYFRFCANLTKLGKPATHIGVILKAAHLVVPAIPGSLNYDLSALAMLIREWGTEDLLVSNPFVTLLLTDNLNDLHPLLVNNPRCVQIQLPQPAEAEMTPALTVFQRSYPVALSQFASDTAGLGAQLAGATISSVESMLKLKEYKKEAVLPQDLVRLKKELVERDCNDLIEFIETKRTLEDMSSQPKLKARLREDIALWRQGDLQAMPMGYLVCGPIGTGKTYMVECLAGEAGVPVVKIKNFRDKWVGSTEGNLEKIFRLLHALGRCFVFVDEADQALGKRDSGSNDSGLSGRIYSMIAKEMSNSENRGRIVWILASSRPDLIEVDLKRPGRVDVKVPIFPTTTAREGFDLIRALCKRRGLVIAEESFSDLETQIPNLLTAGAAEALAVKAYRTLRTRNLAALEAVRDSLKDYQAPIAREVMEFQMRIAVNEATDWEFVPPALQHLRDS